MIPLFKPAIRKKGALVMIITQEPSDGDSCDCFLKGSAGVWPWGVLGNSGVPSNGSLLGGGLPLLFGGCKGPKKVLPRS